MDENVLQDLKQFISTTISQQTAQLATKEDLKQLGENLTRVEEKIDDISESVADALDVGNETTQSQLNDHEMRITKLEQKTA